MCSRRARTRVDRWRDDGIEVVDVAQGFMKERRYVWVVELVDDVTSIAVAADQPKVAQDAQLVGHSGLFHLHSVHEFADTAFALTQARQDPDAACSS